MKIIGWDMLHWLAIAYVVIVEMYNIRDSENEYNLY